ncbi:hypothetical protein QJS66_06590 [Kocuria rhizophila]|nr:hypothetical protein QJS66_06590 [Kocuria rhizophila]
MLVEDHERSKAPRVPPRTEQDPARTTPAGPLPAPPRCAPWGVVRWSRGGRRRASRGHAAHGHRPRAASRRRSARVARARRADRRGGAVEPARRRTSPRSAVPASWAYSVVGGTFGFMALVLPSSASASPSGRPPPGAHAGQQPRGDRPAGPHRLQLAPAPHRGLPGPWRRLFRPCGAPAASVGSSPQIRCPRLSPRGERSRSSSCWPSWHCW